METIFDYNLTERELRRFGISKEWGNVEEQIEKQKNMFAKSKQPEYYWLGILFFSRGDKKRADEYFAKAEQWQRDLLIQDF
jgi:hypothetical protein